MKIFPFLADYIHVCHKNDVKLSDCMIESIDFLRPHLAKGIPEANIPSIEPLSLGDLLVSEKTKSNNGLQVTAKNIKVWGPSQFSFRSLE